MRKYFVAYHFNTKDEKAGVGYCTISCPGSPFKDDRLKGFCEKICEDNKNFTSVVLINVKRIWWWS